jgi:xanthine dehydrogenase iron-sulfur cluster and FAD-binding subunit A
MSGFIMATVGSLKTTPNPTRAELAHGISGNLCRCQDYDKILTAMIMLAAARALGGNSPALKDASASLLSPLTELRRVAAEIAVAVGIEAMW